VSESHSTTVPSRRYQDYVFRDGRFVGAFDDMYRHSSEVPWHQDQTVNAIFSDLAVAILRHYRVTSLLEVGCGLGYMADRFRREIPSLRRVAAMDVSPTAIESAAAMFSGIEFAAGTLDDAPIDGRFDVVVSKDVLWYVLDRLDAFVAQMARRSTRFIYIGQSFPESRPFVGDDILPDAAALLDRLRQSGSLIHSAVERDAAYSDREYVHALVQVSHD
jgi:SAM-dependent methyltransferase